MILWLFYFTIASIGWTLGRRQAHRKSASRQKAIDNLDRRFRLSEWNDVAVARRRALSRGAA